MGDLDATNKDGQKRRLQTLIKSTKGLFMWKRGTKIFDVAIPFIKTLDAIKNKLCRFETLGDPYIDLQIYSSKL